jgi:hypothetical protein
MTSAMHEQLRKATAKMLGYDYDNLTSAQSVRLDRAAMLRLELDDCQTAKLNGQPFDMVKYIAASESLERLMGGTPDEPYAAGDVDAILHQIEHQLDGAIAADELKMAQDPDAARADFEQRLSAAIEKLAAHERELKETIPLDEGPTPKPDDVDAPRAVPATPERSVVGSNVVVLPRPQHPGFV